MRTTLILWGIWTGIAIAVSSVLWWLFGLAMPGAALEFTIGTTTIIMSGMITGWYVSRVWYNVYRAPSDKVLISLISFIIVGMLVVAFLMARMVGETRLFDFALTVLMLFLVLAAFGATASLFRIRIKYRLHVAHTAAAQSKSELQLLQSQLSPHFLFNTLNNIYGLSISDHTKVPPLLLRLSDLLRYSVYNAGEFFVPVKDEIAYLTNYIEFEKIRVGERWELQWNFTQLPDEVGRIAPMVLIVFVENAFKHASNVPGNKVYIYMNMQYKSDAISFSVRNSAVNGYSRSSQQQQRHSGFGLDNVKKRLSLLYPQRHTLDIEKSESEFRVTVTLPVLR